MRSHSIELEYISLFLSVFAQFFKYYRVLNTRFLAERIGMNPTLLSQYINGHKKPSSAQRQRILEGIRQIGEELAELSFETP